jgi:two-component system chemotaxis sensor kinase CheA
MSFDPDDDILQDFLVEAGEILEQLNEQLVDLEQSPDDMDLLNAVFRGFHTIKGGAGFLNLENLVTISHRAEDVFSLLRQGERHIDADLMDAMLPVLDVLNAQFDELRSGQEPSPAPDDLIQRLTELAVPDSGAAPEPVAEAGVETAASEPESPVVEGEPGDITDAEFEALLDAMPESGEGRSSASSSDEITEDEFDALLDDIHGKGKFGAIGENAASSEPEGNGDLITDEEFDALLDDIHGKGKFGAVGEKAASSEPDGASDLITDEEFDNLLDELHGKGKGPTAGGSVKPPQAPTPEAEKSAAEAKPSSPKPATTEPSKAPTAKPAPAETTVRVDTRRLDDIMNLVGELVLVRNRLSTLRATMQDEQMSKAVSNLDLVTSDLQTAVMKTRMQPIKKVFGRFPRVVRDLSRNLGKKVKLVLRGEDTDLDKNLVEALADPLVHLVRNAVDHGVEMPDIRKANGKPEEGTVILSAAQEGDHIELLIDDDGKGMDPDVLRSKAVEKGLMDEENARRLTDKEAYNLIFMPGFSTKTEISDVSGRGVGMDVVKTSIAALNGSVEIDSELGNGSVIRIKVPLTLAIMPTLMIIVGGQRFAIPLTSVAEIFDLDLSNTNVVDDQEVVIVREKALPLFYLRNWLVRSGSTSDSREGHVVVVFVGNKRVGLVVDQLVGQEEVVIKPLGSGLHGLPGFAGATITGDGGIALILDTPSLIQANT